MKVLIGCESSGAVRRAFRALGHDAWSCDLLPADDSDPHHFQCDVLQVIDREWDIGIFHPPCTYLCSSGLHWNKRVPGRDQLTDESLAFVRRLMDAPIEKIGIENPIGCIGTRIRKPDQIIQPYQFGHDASKATCLWLKNLPPLRPTKYIEPRMVCCGAVLSSEVGVRGCPNCNGTNKARPRWGNQTDGGQNKLPPSIDRWKIRSETFEGIASAMALQWSAANDNSEQQLDLFGATV